MAKEVKPQVSSPEGDEVFIVESEAPPIQKVVTKWSALDEARLVPTKITCEGYRPTHRVDNGCHSRLRLNPSYMKQHLEGGHGGGFRLYLRKGDKPWPGWKICVEQGLEAVDFRCEVCDAVVPFSPMHIAKHMKAHSGKSRRVLTGGVFNITLSVGIPIPTEEEALADWVE